MTADDMPDRILTELADLRPLLPDARRAASTRARCHTQLRGRAAAPPAPTPGFGWRILAPGVVLALCALYLTLLVRTVFHVRSVV